MTDYRRLSRRQDRNFLPPIISKWPLYHQVHRERQMVMGQAHLRYCNPSRDRCKPHRAPGHEWLLKTEVRQLPNTQGWQMARSSGHYLHFVAQRQRNTLKPVGRVGTVNTRSIQIPSSISTKYCQNTRSAQTAAVRKANGAPVRQIMKPFSGMVPILEVPPAQSTQIILQ